MQCQLTVLCENSVIGSLGLIGEHGWSVHLKAGNKNVLFDTGQGIGLLRNSRLLGINLRDLDGIVISHGHYDHASGLPDVLNMTGEVEVFIHPDSFGDRYWAEGDDWRAIGIRHKQTYLESLGAKFHHITQFTELYRDIYLSGEVPRVTDFEPPDPLMKIPAPDGTWQQDPLRDDQTIVIRTDKGLVVLLGCAHAGLINILHHVTAQLPGEPVHAVLGGTHLGFADPVQFAATVEALAGFNVQKLGASHCTGLANSAKLHHIYGENFFFPGVGTRMTW